MIRSRARAPGNLAGRHPAPLRPAVRSAYGSRRLTHLADGGHGVVQGHPDVSGRHVGVDVVGREDLVVDLRRCLPGYAARVGSLGPGLTSESAEAVSGCPVIDLS